MADKEQIIQALRATLISVKGALTLKQVNRDFRELQGEWIPFKKLGYSSLEKLFLEVPGFTVKYVNGECLVDAIPTPESQHIALMVAQQKPNKKSAPRLNYPNRFSRKQGSWRKPTQPSQYTSNHNNQYSNQYYRAKSDTTFNNNTYGSKNVNKHSSYKTNETKSTISTTKPTPAAVTDNFDKSFNTTRSNNSKSGITRASSYTEETHVKNVTVRLTHENVKHSGKASERLSTLINHLSKVDLIPLQLPAANNECLESSGPVTHVAAAHALEPPPDLTSSVSKLEWTCRKLGLPQPVYKVCDMLPNKGLVSYDCTIKVGSTFLSSYPNSSPSEELAKEVAAVKMLTVIESSEADGLPTSSNVRAVAGLVELVAEHEAGLWASNVPLLYRQKYEENLPGNWQELVENCPRIKKDRVVNGLLVLVPNKEEASPLYLEPSALDDTIDSELPPLQFPDKDYWDVFITVANSSLEIWLVLVGEEYISALNTVRNAMEQYYKDAGTTVDKSMIIVNAWYAVYLENGGWQRAKVLDVDEQSATVFLGDHGDDDTVALDMIKILEPQFRKLPAQAILCRLDGAEELAGSSLGAELVHRRLADKVFVAVPGPRHEPADVSIAVVLYDTTTAIDLNVNVEIVRDFCTAGAFTVTQKLCEVVVGCVTEEGRVWVSSKEGSAVVRAALALLTSGPYRRPLPSAPAAPPPATALYIVRTISGEWVRCTIISGLDGEGTVRTQLVDSGLILRAPLSSLVPLTNFSAALNAYPHQAMQVRLGPAERAAGAMVVRLRELLIGAPVLCRATHAPHAAPSTPNVELFVRTGPKAILASVNNAIVIEYEYLKPSKLKEESEKEKTDHIEALKRKKERIFRSTSNTGTVICRDERIGEERRATATLPPPLLPPPGKCIDVYVAMAASPWNFVVQPNSTRHILQTMMASLQLECPKLSENDAPKKPIKGELYTVYYSKDASWYRVTISECVSTDNVSVYFCDYGDMALFSISELRPVPEDAPIALSLPPQAIKARLYDVCPLDKDWNVEDCIRFQELCVEQLFVGMCKDLGRDPLHEGEPLLTLDLVDTSTDEDVFLNKQLVAEGRARLASSSN